MEAYENYDAVGLADLVSRKEVSPLELVETAIAQIEKYNPQINAVITRVYESAREVAASELPPGPFSGVPFLLKDLLASYRGAPMASGNELLKSYRPDFDSELVQRFKRAGLIILGKTNTPEFGLQPTTEPRAFGPSRNPWDLERSTGGSSGGSAAAVAARMVPMAHGNDGGGSIRIPAACCGVFGLKPTRGRVSLAPSNGDLLSGLIVENALTRSVRDMAGLLDVISGPVVGDPYWPEVPETPYRDVIQGDPKALRIGVTTEAWMGLPVHQDCQQIVHQSAKLLSELGHSVEERNFHIDTEFFGKAFITVWSAGVAANMALIASGLGHEPPQDAFEPLTWALYEIGREKRAAEYLAAINEFQKLSRRFAAHFTEIDVWMTPTLGMPPVPIGYLDSTPEDPLKGFFAGAAFVPFTALVNVTGQPAVSVPLFWNSEGLPLGTHLIAAYGQEALLLQLSAQLEKAQPWIGKKPPLLG